MRSGCNPFFPLLIIYPAFAFCCFYQLFIKMNTVRLSLTRSPLPIILWLSAAQKNVRRQKTPDMLVVICRTPGPCRVARPSQCTHGFHHQIAGRAPDSDWDQGNINQCANTFFRHKPSERRGNRVQASSPVLPLYLLNGRATVTTFSVRKCFALKIITRGVKKCEFRWRSGG